MRSERAFTARAISAFGLDRLYRVHISGKEMFFIKVGGQAGVAQGVAAQFGMVGGLLLSLWQKRAGARLQERLSADGREDLQQLMARDPKNFRLDPGGIMRSSLEPPAPFPTHGPHAGKWVFEDTRGKKHTLQLETLSEMHEAMSALPAILGPSLTVNAVWDQLKNAYVKKAAAGRPT